MKQVHDIAATFAVLAPHLEVTPVQVTPTIYQELDRDFNEFRGHWLLSRYAFSEAWPSWERHPAGDEIVLLVSGDVTLRLETASGVSEVRMSSAGSYFIVPANTWHTMQPHSPAETLFITPGEGTENRPV